MDSGVVVVSCCKDGASTASRLSSLNSIWRWPLFGLLASFLYGVQPTDPTTAVSVVVVLFAVGSLAMCLPSWRATRVAPVAVLRRG